MPRALILGLGQSGLAMARWLARGSWDLVVADTRERPPMLEALRERLPRAAFLSGPFGTDLLDGVSLLALSPGLSPRQPGVREMVAEAARRGIDRAGEIELFARALDGLRQERAYAPVLVGVTGTNGKTTTTRMVARMFERAGRSVSVAGNISPSALDALAGALDAGRLPQAWVLELSSFQLAGASSLRCTAAAVLNLSEDHLDWHEGMDDYAASKARVFAPGTVRVLNRDDARVRAMLPPAGDAARVLTFGSGAPDRPGQYGLVREGGLAWLACTDEDDAPRRRRRAPRAGAEAGVSAPESEAPMVHRLMPVDALPVRGTHNALNALAALALACAAGLALAPALRALEEFRPEPHRTQTVASIDGVEYIDDSKGTNVGATQAALNGLAAAPGAPGRIVAILGGDGKGQSFEPLAEPLRQHARAVVLIGRDAPRIEQALQGLDLPLVHCADLESAVRAASQLARPGDTVLLSPACASLDMFRDYAHRAQVFVEAVARLAAERGAQGPAVLAQAAPQEAS